MSIHPASLDLQDPPYFVSSSAPTLTVVGASLRFHTTLIRERGRKEFGSV